MQQTGKRQFAIKKTYEIAYALFRVGARVSSTSFKESLERQALALLNAATADNYASVANMARGIEYLVKFGGDVGMLNIANTETIIAELGNLNAAIAGLESNPAKSEEVPLEDIFVGHEELFPAVQVPANGNAASNNTATAKMRQAAILEKIRQSGNCRLKELQELLPDSSERTLRYDLQSLIEQNRVERLGTGGPTVSYRVRQPEQVQIQAA